MAVEVVRQSVPIKHESAQHIEVREGHLFVMERQPDRHQDPGQTIAIYSPNAWDTAQVVT